MNKDREAGKGDTYRPVDKQKFNDNYDRIFKKKEDHTLHEVSTKVETTGE